MGTEHLLLALARSREGGAPDLLRTLTISPDQIRRRVRLLLNDGVTELSLEAAKRAARLSELSRRVLNAARQWPPRWIDRSSGYRTWWWCWHASGAVWRVVGCARRGWI